MLSASSESSASNKRVMRFYSLFGPGNEDSSLFTCDEVGADKQTKKAHCADHEGGGIVKVVVLGHMGFTAKAVEGEEDGQHNYDEQTNSSNES